MLEDVKYREILVNLYDDKLSSHKLSIELDRRSRIDRYKRKCSNCNLRDSKVKYPFVLICPDPSDLRKSHCPLYYFNVENDITCTLINAKNLMQWFYVQQRFIIGRLTLNCLPL